MGDCSYGMTAPTKRRWERFKAQSSPAWASTIAVYDKLFNSQRLKNCEIEARIKRMEETSMHFMAVAFYTIGTPYEQEVKKLEDSCAKFGIPLTVYPVESKGTWTANCAQKAAVLVKAFREHSCDLVYLDADAVVMKPFTFPTFDGHIATYFKGDELLTGTIFIKHTDEALNILRRWEMSQTPHEWDQKTLQRVAGREVAHVGQEFCKIFDNPGPEPVIQQNQASRRLKKTVTDWVPATNAQLDEINAACVGAKTKVRKTVNGVFFIPRPDKIVEAYMTEHFIIGNSVRTWLNVVQDPDEVKGLSLTEHCYLIGKGPDLDHLTAEDFPRDSAIICINESIHAIEALGLPNPLYMIQQDDRLGTRAHPRLETTTCIVSKYASQHFVNIKKVTPYTPQLLGCSASTLTAVVAVRIMQIHNVKEVTLYGFNACVNRDTSYSKFACESVTKNGLESRFLEHATVIKQAVSKFGTFSRPKSLS